MKLPQKNLTKINDLGDSLDTSKIKISKKTILIPKERSFYIPNSYARAIQKELLRLLQVIKFPPYVYSQKGYFFADMAKHHLKSKYLVNLDIKNFFESIHYKKISWAFHQLGVANLSTNLKLTKLTTYHGTLPQGFITSPILSNLLISDIDESLFRLTQQQDIKYTRYVDDLTFSSNKIISEEFLLKVKRILRLGDFKLNEAKTEIYGAYDIKTVLGIRLSGDDLNITESYLDRIVIHLNIIDYYLDHASSDTSLIDRAKGELNFIKQINTKTLDILQSKFAFISDILNKNDRKVILG